MPVIPDLNILPKTRDSWSYLYIDHARIEQHHKAIAISHQTGTTPIPIAILSVLLLGPGTTITHAAIQKLAQHDCLVEWVGEESVRFYAAGLGKTRRAHNLQRQAIAWADPQQHLSIVRRMYEMRFATSIPPNLTLQQLRGHEGRHVRQTYATISQKTNVPWHGRSYNRAAWQTTDPINRALSTANSCLYGICHAAIVALGYSPGLGFIHTGKLTSFVYDIADLYKTSTTIPIAFQTVAESELQLETRVRHACRDLFHQTHLLNRLTTDLTKIFDTGAKPPISTPCFNTDPAVPGNLWDPESTVPGGTAHDTSPQTS